MKRALKSLGQALVCLKGWERYCHGLFGAAVLWGGSALGWLLLASMALGLCAAWAEKYRGIR